ncbi:MAG: molybdenum cofactor biosynthesis protein MoaE, partial [Nitrospinota bacterium]
MFEITERPISPREVMEVVAHEANGAIAHFSGVVRRYSRGRKIRYLEYQAYPAMAEKKMRQIGREVAERFGVEHLAMIHRVGR